MERHYPLLPVMRTSFSPIASATAVSYTHLIAAEGVQFGADVIEKAEEEGVALITTDLSAYHVAGRMHEKGIA